MREIPKSIRIGPITYQVVIVETMSNYGESNHAAQTITLRKMSEEQLWVTLWHEILHCALSVSGRNKQDENMVDALAYLLVDMFDKNGLSILPIAGANSLAAEVS